MGMGCKQPALLPAALRVSTPTTPKAFSRFQAPGAGSISNKTALVGSTPASPDLGFGVCSAWP